MCTQSCLLLSFISIETPVEAAPINDIETSADTDEVVEVECSEGEVLSKSAKDVGIHGSVSKKNRKVTQDQVLHETI